VPSQFSALGFDVTSGEDLAALATHVAERADTVNAREGQYLKWAPPSGEQLWLQLTRSGDAMGMTPHFEGRSRLRIGIEARVTRKTHTPLDATFLAWANPPDGSATGGDYPFVFDCPDGAIHEDAPLPMVAEVQLAAFAQQLTLHDSEEAYRASQSAEGMNFPARSFIPSGLISPTGEPVVPPESHALISGVILEAAPRRNAISGAAFWWALVDAPGGTFDVVIDPDLLDREPRAGHVLSGWFWLSGRLQTGQPSRSGWFRKLTGRGQ